jgi:hypothetical protein
MTIDRRFLERLGRTSDEIDGMIEQALHLKSGGGGGTSWGMEERVTRLETHMEYVRRDLDEIRGTLGRVEGTLAELPKKRGLEAWRWQWVGVAIAVIALTTTVITGSLGLITWLLERHP